MLAGIFILNMRFFRSFGCSMLSWIARFRKATMFFARLRCVKGMEYGNSHPGVDRIWIYGIWMTISCSNDMDFWNMTIFIFQKSSSSEWEYDGICSYILVAISSIKWSHPGTLLNHFFRHYKMENIMFGVVLEWFIRICFLYSFWASTTL